MNHPPPLDTAILLKRFGFRPRHRLGQNFLHDASYLERITAEARIDDNDTVLEVGSGFGNLTQHLCMAAKMVVAIELDESLVAIARTVLETYSNVRLICGNVLELTPQELSLPPAYVVAANIPYYLTSPILRHLIECEPKPRRIVLTVQKEVAERICAEPPDMSLLALSVQVYGRAEFVAEIPAAAFYPIPKVDSAVVRIEVRPQPHIAPDLLPTFFRLARAGFGQRRKTLRNTLAAGLHITPAAAKELLLSAGIDPQRRAESINLEEWATLTDKAAPQAD